VTGESARASGGGRDHYSYAHYADKDVAEGFHDLRFGGPIGRYILEREAAWMAEAIQPAPGLRILDVATGSGRAAIGFAAAGATVIGLDFSREMLRAGRERVAAAHVNVALGVADAHRLPIATQSVDAAVCLRLLMHVIDWRGCVSELCRVTRSRVVVDFPALGSAAALESAARHVAHRLGRGREPYRVFAERDMVAAFASHGFRLARTRRLFVLPIALHKAVGLLGLTRAVESALSAVGLSRLFGSPVMMVFER